jgi:hypothetical protein
MTFRAVEGNGGDVSGTSRCSYGRSEERGESGETPETPQFGAVSIPCTRKQTGTGEVDLRGRLYPSVCELQLALKEVMTPL